MFDNWDMMDGSITNGFWMPVALVLITLIIVIGIWLIVRSNRATSATGPTAAEILGQRFAKGEISKDEFEAAKRTLGV